MPGIPPPPHAHTVRRPWEWPVEAARGSGGRLAELTVPWQDPENIVLSEACPTVLLVASLGRG